MTKKPTEAEADKYPDGTPIVRYPKWIYPNNKPEHSSPRKEGHNGVLVNSKEEHDAYLKEHPEFGEEDTFEETYKPDKKAKGWDK